MLRPAHIALVATAALVATSRAQGAEPVTLSADEIVARFESADRLRRESMPAHSSVRHYVVENDRFHTKAAMTVDVDIDAGGTKRFKVREISGPVAVQKLVFQRMLKTEAQASHQSAQTATRISAKNYTFRFIETTVTEGRRQYVLDAEPRKDDPLLFRGRIWIDAEVFAIARIEGTPAQSPSFWVNKTRFVHLYSGTSGRWLAISNRSESDIRLFGHSTVTITYGDYKFAGPPGAPPPALH